MKAWLVIGVLGFLWYRSIAKDQPSPSQPFVPDIQLPPTPEEINLLVSSGIRREDAEAMSATQVRQLLRGQYAKGIIDYLP